MRTVSPRVALLIALAGSACTPDESTRVDPSGAHHPHFSQASPEINQRLDSLRMLVAPFHNFDKAVAAGYSVGVGCVSDPVLGGMGYHYTRADKDLINDGVVNLLEPEFLVYAPRKGGPPKFSALDYFVPYNTWTSPEPPTLLGVPFMREDRFQAWVIHVWLYWNNPDGIFSNYNRDVPQCPSAQ
ncbi:MAG TPA: hypothetical protein VK864_17035 [Longimicrobiales bacterium]|nr:hypothetical protein [Longimicrobiales bacterium]